MFYCSFINKILLEFECCMLSGRCSSVRWHWDTEDAFKTFTSLKIMTNKLVQRLLFQMSPLPVCVLSLLPCGAPEGCRGPAVAQEVEDAWRVRRGLLSLSTPGNSQPGRGSPTRASAQQRRGIPTEHAQSMGLILGSHHSFALPLSKPPEDETHKLHCPNYDGLRMRLSLCCCYFCWVR